MSIRIGELKQEDHKKAIEYAIKGMDFRRYIENKTILYLYGKYFWYLELLRATRVLAAYDGEKLEGILLAEVYGEEKRYRSLRKRIYVKCFSFFQKLFSGEGGGVYEETAKHMESKFAETNRPDGEILFFAVNPEAKRQKTGSLLLSVLQEQIPGKKMFLHTDDACSWQFYERRGFERAAEKDVLLHLGRKKTLLKCMIYHKRM